MNIEYQLVYLLSVIQKRLCSLRLTLILSTLRLDFTLPPRPPIFSITPHSS